MKKFAWISGVIIAVSFYACDKVSNPYISKGNRTVAIPVVPPTRVYSTDSSASDDNLKKILVEDYTGHTCTNCPSAATQCEQLLSQATNPNQAIIVQQNASQLAYPKPHSAGLPDTAYATDFITLADSNWNNQFIDGDNNGMPATMVDRLYYNGNVDSPNLVARGLNVSVPYDSLDTTPQTAIIHIVDSMYAPPTNVVSMSISVKILNPQLSVQYSLVVMLVEDSIYDWQDSVGHDRPYYLHRMVCRGTINDGGGGSGALLLDTNIMQKKHYVFTSPKFKYYNGIVAPPQPLHISPITPDKWNMAHMYVVAFVYQNNPGHPGDQLILQAQRLHI